MKRNQKNSWTIEIYTNRPIEKGVTAVGVGEIRNNNGDGDVLQHGISFERGKNTESLTENRCIALDIIQIDRYLALEVQIF